MPITRRPLRLCLALLLGAAATACGSAFRFDEQRPESVACAIPDWCVSGTVTDRFTGASIPAAQVVIAGTACGAVADVSGRFRLVCADAPGDTLIARGIGYVTLRRRVTIVIGRSYVAEIQLDPLPASMPVF